MAMVEKGFGISILPELLLRGQQFNIQLNQYLQRQKGFWTMFKVIRNCSNSTLKKIFHSTP